MPKEEEAAADYRLRMASLLALLRTATGWTQSMAEERMQIPIGKLGRWERADYPPKAFELAAIYKAYEWLGIEMDWLIWPPDLAGLTDVREKLSVLARAGAIAADEAEARAMLRRLQSGARLAAARGKRSA
jgi:transcriptional regulator with XRE-family HTH domain